MDTIRHCRMAHVTHTHLGYTSPNACPQILFYPHTNARMHACTHARTHTHTHKKKIHPACLLTSCNPHKRLMFLEQNSYQLNKMSATYQNVFKSVEEWTKQCPPFLRAERWLWLRALPLSPSLALLSTLWCRLLPRPPRFCHSEKQQHMIDKFIYISNPSSAYVSATTIKSKRSVASNLNASSPKHKSMLGHSLPTENTERLTPDVLHASAGLDYDITNLVKTTTPTALFLKLSNINF